jgi:hypothetical protein
MEPLTLSPIIAAEASGPPEPLRLSAAELLHYASLLSGLGAWSSSLPDDQAPVERKDGSRQEVLGRTCIDAGSSMMFSVVAPGRRSLRVLSRLRAPVEHSDGPPIERSDGALAAGVISWQRLHRQAGKPLERWHSETYLGEPPDIWARIEMCARRVDGLERFRRAHAVLGPRGRIYSLSYRLDGPPEATMSWRLDRFFRLDETLDLLGFPGAWKAAAWVWEELLGFPASLRTGPWSILLPLHNTEPRLRIGSTNWARLPEGAEKRRRLAGLVERLGGDGRYAQALYKLIEEAGRSGRRPAIGRAVEVELEGSQVVTAEFFLCVP